MLSLFRQKRQKPPPPPTVNLAEGYLPVESPQSLLATEHRWQLLDRIWQYTALSHPQFSQLYLNPIHRYAELSSSFQPARRTTMLILAAC